MPIKNKPIKIVQAGAKFLWKEMLESISFLLWLSTPPFTTKAFRNFLGDEYYPGRLKTNLRHLYQEGFIFRIKKGRTFLFKFKRPPKEFFWPEQQLLKEAKFKEKWRGSWWILIYDVPEKIKSKREALRLFLKGLSFGRLQDSCWISPYNFSSKIHGFCSTNAILENVYLYEAKFFSGKDIAKAVEEIWNLNKLDKRYGRFKKMLSEQMGNLKRKGVDYKDYIKTYVEFYEEYKDILSEDPFLPKEFLKGWPREKVTKLFNQFCKLLSEKLTLAL